MDELLPSHPVTVSASIGDKLYLRDKRHEKTRILLGFGRGGGDRTHDLRLKRPLLYH